MDPRRGWIRTGLMRPLEDTSRPSGSWRIDGHRTEVGPLDTARCCPMQSWIKSKLE